MDSNPLGLPSIPILTSTLALLVAGAACAAPTPPVAVASPPAADGERVAVSPSRTAGTAATDWKRVLPRPQLPADRPLAVAFLLTDGVDGSELVAPFDVFHHLGSRLEAPGVRTFTVSPDGGAARSAGGLEITAEHAFADAPAIDVLVVPGGGSGPRGGPTDPALLEWVAKAGAAARWVVSLRDGAFLLAQAGLLDGRAATTSPASYDHFAGHFPGIDLRVNVSFVHDEPLLTSQGGARSFDVALYLVDHLYGEEVARAVAADLLLEWPPDHESLPRFVVVPRPPGHLHDELVEPAQTQ